MKIRLLPMLMTVALAACAGNNAPDTTQNPDADAATAAPADAAPAATAPGDTAALATQLPRHHWRLQDATAKDGSRIAALFARADKPVTLDFADGRINVSNTCNHMGGSYTLKGDALNIGNMASTMMACSDPQLMALDGAVGTRLEGELTIAVEGSSDAPQLRLKNAAGDTLVFAGEATAENRFGGEGETVFLEVAAQTKPCTHPLQPEAQCLQVRELRYDDKGLRTGTPGAFENFYDGIEGYTHTPGTRNVLRVKRFKVANPPADGSSLAYVLDMVVESDQPKAK